MTTGQLRSMNMPLLFAHDRGCPKAGIGHSDAAKRVSDTYALHKVAAGDISNWLGQFFAAALADGTSDGHIYPSKSSAIAHQHHNENYYTYIQLTPANMTVCAAEVMIDLARRLYDAGMRVSDPDVGKRDVITRMNFEDQVSYLKGIPSNIIFDKKGEYS